MDRLETFKFCCGLAWIFLRPFLLCAAVFTAAALIIGPMPH